MRAGWVIAAALAAAALHAAPALAAAPAPALSLSAVAAPTNFVPGDGAHEYSYETWITNAGGAPADGSPVTVTDTLPKGLVPLKTEFFARYKEESANVGEGITGVSPICETQTLAEVSTVTCTVPEELSGSDQESAALEPGEEWYMRIVIDASALSVEGEQLTNLVEVEGGGAPAAEASARNEASSTPAPAGFAEAAASLTGPDGQLEGQAGSHPYQMTTSFSLNTRREATGKLTVSGGDVKDIPIALPPGLIGNPTAVLSCTVKEFNANHTISPHPKPDNIPQNECPNGSAVGYIALRRTEGGHLYDQHLPIYNMAPPPGMPGQLGFNLFGLPIFIDAEARPSDNYRVIGVTRNIDEVKRVIAARVVLWGTPADESHDTIRGHCLNTNNLYPISLAPYLGHDCPAEAPQVPFLRLPSSCASPVSVLFGLDTWAAPGAFSYEPSPSPAPVGCNALSFDPTLEARPSTSVADSPSGLDVDLHIPQPQDPEGLGEADLRDAVVTLPEGMALNPASANGLEGCSEDQAGFTGLQAGTAMFDDEAASCPGASRIGEVEISTPLLAEPLHGGVFAAAPFQNPFGSLLAIYIAVDDPERGIVVKLAGKVEPDPQTGQLKTTFANNPQVPAEDFKLKFRQGPLAPLRTPPTCGAHTVSSQMTPWSAPESGPPARPSDTWAIDRGAEGGSCPATAAQMPNSPAFEAGTEAPLAGAYSPMVIRLRRGDGSQEFGQLTLTPPPGLLARLAGIPYCADAALAAAASKSGRAEEASPSCPAASEVGSVEVGAGAGPSPYYATGKAYLAGPYKGAPLSLAVITPAAAGPYDLGTVVVRTALHVNPATAQITAVSDPIPHILAGIPLDVRSVTVRLDHPGWGLNPTSCDPFSFGGALLSTLGQAAPLQSRFQVGECGRLGFKPKLGLRLIGKTRRGAFPALRATYAARQGDANLKDMVLRFPRSEFIEQGHFRTICTRVQYAEGAGGGEKCPPGSVYGHIRATTPLLAQPLEGPVYLRSSSHNLPDVVFALHGQVDAEVAVRIDSSYGGLRARIEDSPDVPVSEVLLEMQGGQKGLFVNSRDICAHKYRADAELDAQSGKGLELKPLLRDSRCKKR